MSLKNKIFYNKFMKKIKYNKCKGCKYLYESDHLRFCCSELYIGPLKLICSKKEKGESKWNFKK